MTGPTTTPRITIRLPHSRCFSSPDAILRVAELADELGFWGVSVEDHFLMTDRPCNGDDPAQGRTIYESLSTLAFVAARTTRVRLITGVLVVPYRHPVMLAKETSTIDALSSGRLILGVGVGALRRRVSAEGVDLSRNADIATREFDAMGVHGDRGALTDEYLEALSVLWADDTAAYQGRHVSFADLALVPAPVQRPIPIWVGGRSEAALRRAARYQGWFPSQCSVPFLAQGRQRIRELVVAQGTDPALVEAMDFGPCNESCVLADGAEAERWMERLFGYHFTSPEALRAGTIAGSPATVAQRVREYAEAGATFVDLRLLPVSIESVLGQMRLVAREVVPALG